MRINSWKLVGVVMLSVFAISCGSGPDEGGDQSADPSGSDTKGQESTGDSASVNDLLASLADVDADILSTQLGMTPDEAYAALSEARPDARVSKPSYVTMTIKTPVPAETEGAYVQGIGINDHRDMVRVQFARPPLENVVMSVERKQSLATAKPQTSLAVYRDALTQKYGEPDEEVVAGNKVMHHFKWLFPPGGTDCYPIEELRSATKWASGVTNLPASPERCAAALVYSLTINNGIVSRAEARLGNAGVIALEIQAHVDYQRELNERAAEAAREAATAAPDL